MPGRTGPTTASGKEKVSRNALKHGLRANKWLDPEEKKSFDKLVQDLVAEYQPSTATQSILIERIAITMTKLRRLQAVEDAMFQKSKLEAASPRSRFQAHDNVPLEVS